MRHLYTAKTYNNMVVEGSLIELYNGDCLIQMNDTDNILHRDIYDCIFVDNLVMVQPDTVQLKTT